MTHKSACKVCMCLHSKCSVVCCVSVLPCSMWVLTSASHVSDECWTVWQGENWPGGFDPALCQSSSASARSRRTLSWVSHLVTWCPLTWLDSLSCPTTVASKETCPPALISPCCHPWTLPAWVHHGNNAKGNSDTCYFVLINDPLLVLCGLLNLQPLQ